MKGNMAARINLRTLIVEKFPGKRKNTVDSNALKAALQQQGLASSEAETAYNWVKALAAANAAIAWNEERVEPFAAMFGTTTEAILDGTATDKTPSSGGRKECLESFIERKKIKIDELANRLEKSPLGVVDLKSEIDDFLDGGKEPDGLFERIAQEFDVDPETLEDPTDDAPEAPARAKMSKATVTTDHQPTGVPVKRFSAWVEVCGMPDGSWLLYTETGEQISQAAASAIMYHELTRMQNDLQSPKKSRR